jgi:hypothetical protein
MSTAIAERSDIASIDALFGESVEDVAALVEDGSLPVGMWTPTFLPVGMWTPTFLPVGMWTPTYLPAA